MADKESLLSQITKSIRDLQQQGGVEKDTADSLSGMFTNFNGLIDKLTESIPQQVSMLGRTVKDAKTLADDIKQILGGPLVFPGTGVPAAIKGITDAKSTLHDQVAAQFGDMEALPQQVADHVDELSVNAGKVGAAIDEFINSTYGKKLFDGISPGDGFPELVGKFDRLAEADRKKITDLVTSIGTAAKPMGSTIVDILRAVHHEDEGAK
ncbi:MULTISPECIES: hypothetical protein [Corynebacterium]|uniref:hypothetical protein n=1 Tax=Corynebacterium TaxID=1716 RepID=UPI00264F3353|nr:MULTISPECIES: hypothetical protein [Corynebacterium]MDN8624597.1 hypothetical protein [Corynebacterium kroppenstedtii]